MRRRFFRRSAFRSARRVLAGDFRVALMALGALVVLLAGLRMGVGGLPEDPPRPSAIPRPSPLPADPGFPAGVAVGPAEVRAALFRLLELGRPVYCGGGRQPVVALTFDDGPGPATNEVIRLLGEQGVPATFFVLGSRLTSGFGKDLVERVGPTNAIGNHGWSHRSLRPLSRKGRLREIRRTQAAIEQVTSSVRLFRPPYGHRNAKIDRLVNGLGLVEVLWNAEVGDNRKTTEAKVIARARAQLRPGAILLMHERPATIAALPEIVAEIRARGLQPLTVPDLLAVDPPSDDQLAKGHCRTDEGFAPPEIGGGRP